MELETFKAYGNPSPSLGFRWHGNLLGNGPHEADQFPSNGDDDLIGMFAFGHELAIPWAGAHDARTLPNNRLQPTAYSLRCAPASGSG